MTEYYRLDSILYQYIEFRIIGNLVRLFSDAALLYNTEEENVNAARL
jgi:hypothetical protein